MFDIISSIFSKAKCLERLARGSDCYAFARVLRQADIFVLAALEGEGLDPWTMTQPELLAEIERTAKDFGRQDGFQPFVYELNTRLRLPFFTSLKRATTFCGAYSIEHDRVYGFTVLGVRGAVLAQIAPACNVLVMNDRSPDAIVLSDDHAAAVQRMCG